MVDYLMPLLPGVGKLVTHFPTPVTVFLFLNIKLINLHGEIRTCKTVLKLSIIYMYVYNSNFSQSLFSVLQHVLEAAWKLLKRLFLN